MNDHRDPDEIIAAWLDDGPTRLPPFTRQVIVAAVRANPQQRTPAWRPWRTRPVTFFAVRLAPIALIAALLGSVIVLRGPIAQPGADVVTPSPSASPAASADGTVYDTAVSAPIFGLGASLSLPQDWIAQSESPRILDIIDTGGSTDPATWWGPGIALLDGAEVHDPADRGFQQPADNNPTRRIPWPDDLAAYLASLPGTTITAGIEPLTIDGVTGSSITFRTEPMPPILKLKDDALWVGAGWDVPVEHLYITLDVAGTPVLLSYEDAPDAFDARLPEVMSVFQSIRWDALHPSASPTTAPASAAP
jgi:hypothetical protein